MRNVCVLLLFLFSVLFISSVHDERALAVVRHFVEFGFPDVRKQFEKSRSVRLIGVRRNASKLWRSDHISLGQKKNVSKLPLGHTNSQNQHVVNSDIVSIEDNPVAVTKDAANYSSNLSGLTYNKTTKVRTRGLSLEHMTLYLDPEYDLSFDPEGRIVKGIPTLDARRYPYMASILNSGKSTHDGLQVWHVCGGTLVAPDVILGAAHCSGSASDYAQLGGNRYGVQVEDIESFRIVEQVTHPLWDRRGFYNDLVLYKLDRPSSKQPITLSAETQDWFDPGMEQTLTRAGDSFTILGWGRTHPTSSPSMVLREANVGYKPMEDCVSTYGELFKTEAMMCFMGKGVDACHGDSGGPVIRKHKTDNFRDDPTYDVQVGVISWGVDCANEKYPGVYARLDLEWIQHAICNVNNGLSPQSCSSDEKFYRQSNMYSISKSNVCRDTQGEFSESWDRKKWTCDKVKWRRWYYCIYYSSYCPETCCPEDCNPYSGECRNTFWSR